jgi:DNA-directed RNA polymerase specialized sigma24 family protein
MNAQTWLEQVKKLDQLINAKLAEREQVWSMITSATASDSDGMPKPKGGVSDIVGDGVVKLRLLADEIDGLIDRYVDLKQEVTAVLEKLPEKEYGVLHRHYIRYMTWEQVAEDMEYSVRQIHRIKDKSLKNLEDVIVCHTMSVV